MYGDTKFEDTNNDTTEEKKLIDGPKTSLMIQHLLEAVSAKSENPQLK
jgi:hypothetical protein